MQQERVLSSFIPFAQAVLDFAVMLHKNFSKWRVPERIKAIYKKTTSELMVGVPYTDGLSWSEEFEKSLQAAAKHCEFGETLYKLYLKIVSDNSYEFCGPLRVPYVLSQLADLPYNPSDYRLLLLIEKAPTFKAPHFYDRRNFLKLKGDPEMPCDPSLMVS